MSSTPARAEGATPSARKVLTFTVQDTRYAIAAAEVREIVGMQNITLVPGTRHYVRGVINLRGQVVPVVDVRLRFGVEPRDYDERTCVIVVRVRGTDIGLAIDSVDDVLDIPESAIEPPPSLTGGAAAPYVIGVAEARESVVILLSADMLLYESADLAGYAG